MAGYIVSLTRNHLLKTDRKKDSAARSYNNMGLTRKKTHWCIPWKSAIPFWGDLNCVLDIKQPDYQQIFGRNN